MQLTAVCFTLLVSCLGAAYSYDCVNSLYGDVRKCFLNEGLDFMPEQPTGDASELLRQAQVIDPATQCKQIDLYKNGMQCAMQFVERCLRAAGMSGVLPDITKMRKGMDVLCQKYHEFDFHCLKNKYMDILQCVKDRMQGIVERYREANRQPSVNEIICTSADLNYDCSELHLRTCPKSTKAIYLEQLDKYQVPSVCENKPPGRSRMNYVEGGAASLTPFFNPFLAMLVSMATLIFLRWSG